MYINNVKVYYTEMAGMFLDSGCLYRSTLRAYPSSGCTVCKDVYVIQAERLIWNAEQISTLCAYICAGAYPSDCNSADPTHT